MAPSWVEIVGEANYQNALRRVAGPKEKDCKELHVPAVLYAEDNNPYDSQAVAVFLGGELAGYLPRDLARVARSVFMGDLARGLECPALIVGGWQRGREDEGHYGVKLWLDLDTSARRTVSIWRRPIPRWAVQLVVLLVLFLLVKICVGRSS